MRDPSFMRLFVVYVLAIACVLVGLAGIVLPVLPGWPFVIVGLVLLAGVNPWVRRGLHRFLNRHPKLDRAYLAIRRAPVKEKPNAPQASALRDGE